METTKKDIIQEYTSWDSLDVLENANRYPGPTGFFAYVMEEALKESISLVPREGREAHFSGIYTFTSSPTASTSPTAPATARQGYSKRASRHQP